MIQTLHVWCTNAAGILRKAKVASKQNLADLLTMPLPAHDLKTMIQMTLW
jgi:hypothetical protein